jgi:ubiquinone/menaquinone biosynthesis C-methylase UbiE
VDYVFANMYLHHVEQPVAAIREMARILKARGKLVDLDEHNFESLRTEQHDRWPGFYREEVRQWFGRRVWLERPPTAWEPTAAQYVLLRKSREENEFF